MSTLRWITAFGLFTILAIPFNTTPASAQVGPPPEFTLFVSQVDPSGLVRISWTPLHGVDFAMFYVYRASVPFVDSTSFAVVDSTDEMEYVDHLPNTSISTGKTYAYFVVGRTTLGLLKKTNIVEVEIPGIPPTSAFRLYAKVDNGVVHLKWERPIVALSTPFSVYRINVRFTAFPTAPGTAGDTALVATTADTLYNDTLPPVLWNLSPSPRAFIYFVSAMTTGNVVIQSSLASVVSSGPDNRDEVKIISFPPLTAQVGVQYSYDVSAVSSNTSAVIHYFVNNPLPVLDPVRCDSVTGLITVTPEIKGIIPIHVVARSNMGGEADQEFQIIVSNSNGVISGQVTDTLSHPIQGVLVEVFKRDARASFSYQAITDSLGNYRITHLDLGSYYVHAIPVRGEYAEEWYDGKASAAEADPVHILDTLHGANGINFKLRSNNAHPLPTYTVQGVVTDTLGLPISIAGTTVYFVNADFALNASSVRAYFELNHAIDFRLRGNSKFVFKTGVDSLGGYTMKIPAGSYVAFAAAPGYAIQFFNQKSYFLVADVINLGADSLGINFNLSALAPVTLGEISGQVLDSVKNIGVRARLIAFRPAWIFAADPNAVRAFFTETDSTGAYEFNDLLPGAYYILALPVGDYAPVFYSNGSQGLRWANATPITVNGNSLSGIDLYPRPLPDSARGYTSINGSVAHSGGMAGAFAGAMVFASYQNGGIAGYTLSDGQGKFLIDGLAPGSYTVSADVPGYTLVSSAQTSPTYDASGKPVGGTVSLILQTTSVQTVTKVLPTAYSIEQNYPNPFNPSTTIRYTLPIWGTVSVRVYNILGQLVTTLVDGNQNAGTYAVTFNASSLSSGVYFYRIESGSFVAIKKMMLLK